MCCMHASSSLSCRVSTFVISDNLPQMQHPIIVVAIDEEEGS